MHTKDDQTELMIHIKDLVDDGVIRTKDIAEKINRSDRQTRRYLVEMSKNKMISLTDSKRMDTSKEQIDTIAMAYNNNHEISFSFIASPIILKILRENVDKLNPVLKNELSL